MDWNIHPRSEAKQRKNSLFLQKTAVNCYHKDAVAVLDPPFVFTKVLSDKDEMGLATETV